MNAQQQTLDRIEAAIAVLRTRLPLVDDYAADLDAVVELLDGLVDGTDDNDDSE